MSCADPESFVRGVQLNSDTPDNGLFFLFDKERENPNTTNSVPMQTIIGPPAPLWIRPCECLCLVLISRYISLCVIFDIIPCLTIMSFQPNRRGKS